MKYYLGIDCGGTMTKSALYTPDGRELAVCAIETNALVPQTGFAERDMDDMRQAVFGTIRNVIADAGVPPADIACVACCGHGKGLYLWGKDGRPVRRAILSTDNRAYMYPERWKKDGTQARAYPMSLQEPMACQPIALLCWLRDNEPEAIEKTQWVFACKDYVRFCLTGDARAELTDYSGCSLVNLRTRKYDLELLECFGLGEIYDKLPPLCTATEICGHIDSDAASATGLPQGTPVAGGMFDINACMLAVNAGREDRLCVIAGTWSINEYIRREPVTDGSVRLNSIFCDPSYYLVEESSATSAGNNEWFIRTLLPELRSQAESSGSSIYGLCNEMVASIPPREYCPVFFPFLYASNVHPNAKSCFIGVNSFHTRAHLVRSVYEGIVFCHKYHIDRLLKSRTEPVSCIRLAGGVARSPVWSQMLADVLRLPVETADVNETGALGCAIAAAVAAGDYVDLSQAADAMVRTGAVYTPDPGSYKYYKARYDIYCRLLEALDPVWDEIQSYYDDNTGVNET